VGFERRTPRACATWPLQLLHGHHRRSADHRVPRRRSAAPARTAKKDTLRNVEATREFVVNVVDDALAAQMNLTSGDYPPEVDEFEVAGLAVAPPRAWTAAARGGRADRDGMPPRAHRARQAAPTSCSGGSCTCTCATASTTRHRAARHAPPAARRRLAGNLYTHVHDIFEMKRPNPDYRG